MTHPKFNANRSIMAALSSLLLSACGGGGGAAAPASAVNAAESVVTEAVPLARALSDQMRALYLAAADVQNLIVFAPILMSRGARLETCAQSGSVQTEILRPEGDPAGPLLRQQYNACREGGITVDGRVEVGYSRRTSEAPDQPWAGRVRYTAYSLQGPFGSEITGGTIVRRRVLQGLFEAEGRVNAPGGGQPLTMRMTDVRLQDDPGSLRRDAVFSTPVATLERVSVAGAVEPLYAWAGNWLLQGSDGLRVTLALDAGNSWALVSSVGPERMDGLVTWQDSRAPIFSGRFSVVPEGRTAMRMSIDLGADGSTDRRLVLDRYIDLGFTL